MPKQPTSNTDVSQAPASEEELNALAPFIRQLELNDKLVEANIKAKRESGYWEAVALNAQRDRERKNDPGRYNRFRRRLREKKADEQGRKLRDYEPSTPERRTEQMRASKTKARPNPDYAAAERARDKAAKAEKRAAMTPAERAEINRIRRENRAAKKKADLAT